jgi:hypothetical protein
MRGKPICSMTGASVSRHGIRMQDAYDAMVMRLARILCAKTNVAPRESPGPIYDEPDDLVWLESPNGPLLAARWRLYEEGARVALELTKYAQTQEALTTILTELRDARLAQRLPDLALIEKLASSVMF